MNTKNTSSLDQLIKLSETEKDLQLTPLLWQRLDRKLNRNKKILAPWIRIIGIAASILLLSASIYIYSIRSHSYLLEDLDITGKPNFSKEELKDIELYYKLVSASSALNG